MLRNDTLNQISDQSSHLRREVQVCLVNHHRPQLDYHYHYSPCPLRLHLPCPSRWHHLLPVPIHSMVIQESTYRIPLLMVYQLVLKLLYGHTFLQ